MTPLRSYATLPCIISTILGLAAALGSLPDETVPAGALRLPALLFLASLAVAALFVAARHGWNTLLRVEWALMAAIVYFLLLDVVQGLYDLPVSREAVVRQFIALTIFCCAIFLGTQIRPPQLPSVVHDLASRTYTTRTLVRVLWLCFIFGIFYYLFMSGFSLQTVIDGLIQPRFLAPWSRAHLGDWYAFIEHMVYFGYLLPPLTALIAIQEGRWVTRRILLGLVLNGLFLVFLLQGGGRRIFGMCVGSAVFAWLCANRDSLRPKRVVALLIVVALSLLTMDLVLANRNRGALEFSYSLDEFQYVRVDDNFLRFAQTLEIIPSQHPYVGFKWLLYVLARPIPRALWPSKPVDPGFSLPEILGMEGVSLSSTSIAEWYMAFGWPGVAIGGLIYGILARFWDQLLEYNLPLTSVAVYGIGLMAMVVSIRGFFELILMSYPLLGWIIVNRIFFRNPVMQPLPRAF